MRIPLVDLVAQQREVHAEVMSLLERLIAGAQFVGGAPVAEFEQSYARYARARHCVGVANGTDAIELALRAAGVGAGGRVLLPANTFIATAEAVVRAGGSPVIVDVDPDTLLMDPKAVAAAIDGRTAAVIPVHLYGQLAPVEDIVHVASAHGAAVIEDAAQSQGALRHGQPAGTIGLAAATSFYPGKNLGAGGDAGAVTTNDDVIAERVRLLGAHGSAQKYIHDVLGFNSRLDAVQAVILSAKLRRLDSWNEARRAAAARYADLLEDVEGVELPTVLAGNVPNWHLYVVRVPDRERVLAELNAAGIGAAIHYPVPVHLTQAFAGLGYRPGDFPVSESAASELLSLPMYPHITEGQQNTVVSTLKRAVLGGRGQAPASQ